MSVVAAALTPAPRVHMENVSKSFGNVRALRNVTLDIFPAEVLAIVGDNGAGKSTLIKILSGAELADHGELFIDGRPTVIAKPQDAQLLGIATIYQDLALFDNLNVAENVFAGREQTWSLLGLRLLRRRSMSMAAHRAVRDLGVVTLDSARPLVGFLSGGQRQMIAVARAIGMSARVLILDEPTAALGIRESRTLLDQVRNLRALGLSIIFITHRLPDALDLADRIVVLKGGEIQGILRPPDCVLEDIVELIVRGRRAREEE